MDVRSYFCKVLWNRSRHIMFSCYKGKTVKQYRWEKIVSLSVFYCSGSIGITLTTSQYGIEVPFFRFIQLWDLPLWTLRKWTSLCRWIELLSFPSIIQILAYWPVALQWIWKIVWKPVKGVSLEKYSHFAVVALHYRAVLRFFAVTIVFSLTVFFRDFSVFLCCNVHYLGFRRQFVNEQDAITSVMAKSNFSYSIPPVRKDQRFL